MHLATLKNRQDPKMCTRPITANDGNTFACRTCNECLATRKNEWVARAMAEKYTSGETLLIELTYRNNEDGTQPDAAKSFRYKDIMNFFKALREEYFREYGARKEIRFLCCGERGSKRGRVHWHMVIFSKQPMSTLGAWTTYSGQPLEKMRYGASTDQWSFWKHGHVYPKKATQAGMQYALKYAMKDQFNVVKSKGTMRFSKADNHAASYFRCSKRPPIGHDYLDQQIDRWSAMGALPTSLKLNIPEYSGYWYPAGKTRERLCYALFDINQRRKAETGRDCPQYQTLLASLVSQLNEWEILTYGQETEVPPDPREDELWQRHLSGRATVAGFQAARIQAESHCSDVLPCKGCFKSLTRPQKAEFKRWYAETYRQYLQSGAAKDRPTFENWWFDRNQVNPWCGRSEEFAA